MFIQPSPFNHNHDLVYLGHTCNVHLSEYLVYVVVVLVWISYLLLVRNIASKRTPLPNDRPNHPSLEIHTPGEMMMKIASFPQNGSGAYDTLKGKDKILFDKVIVGIVNSKKVVVVSGAGLSCSSGIPVSLSVPGYMDDDRRSMISAGSWAISGSVLIGSELNGSRVVDLGFSVGEWTLLVGRADGIGQYPFRQQQ